VRNAFQYNTGVDADNATDNTNPIGPCLVSAAKIGDPQKLGLKTIVNGQTLQDGTTA